MPTYQYACTESACGHQFEKVQSFSDTALTTCPICEGRLRKVFSPVGVVFKGSGFYRTDSRAANGSKDGAKRDESTGGKDSVAAKSDSAAKGAKGSDGGSSEGSGSAGSSSTKPTSDSAAGSTSTPKAAAT